MRGPWKASVAGLVAAIFALGACSGQGGDDCLYLVAQGPGSVERFSFQEVTWHVERDWPLPELLEYTLPGQVRARFHETSTGNVVMAWEVCP
jgi:hypothetical protein